MKYTTLDRIFDISNHFGNIRILHFPRIRVNRYLFNIEGASGNLL